MPDLTSLTTLQFWTFFQVLARVSALVAVAPVFGAHQAPNQVKVGLAVLLSLVLTPIAAPHLAPQGVPTDLYGLVAPLVAQVALGLTMGFVVSLVLTAVQMAGSLLDLQAGFTMAQTFNPAIGEMAAPLTQFQSMYALLLFLLAHGHYVLIQALARSFSAVPASMAFGGPHFAHYFADATFAVLVNALKIAAPAGAVLLVIDVSFALLSKAMPQMNIFYVGMPLKTLASVLLLIVVLPLFAAVVGQMVAQTPADMAGLFRGLHP